MGKKHTHDELVTMVIAMQGQMDALNENIERFIEQVRIANSYRFDRHTEKLEATDGQLSFFDEADAIYDGTASAFPDRPWRTGSSGAPINILLRFGSG